jgi:hypothetical protein
MGPPLAFLLGAVLIWLVANGKAADIWSAAFGTGKPAIRPPDPSTGAGGTSTSPLNPLPSQPGVIQSPPTTSTG